MSGLLPMPAGKIILNSDRGYPIRNESFETGNLDYWDSYGASVISGAVYDGSYCVYMKGTGQYIEQTGLDFTVDETTTLILAFCGVFDPGGYGTFDIIVTYSDETSTTINKTCGGAWNTEDILSSLTSGKVVNSIKVITTNAKTVYIDYIHWEGIGHFYTEVDEEVILGISLHLGGTKEVSSFEVNLDRGNPSYDLELDPGESFELTTGNEIEIYLGRGENIPLLLTGRMEEVEYEDEVEEFEYRNIVSIRGRCEGLQLFARKYGGNLIDDIGTSYKNYNRTAGDAASLVAYLIDNYTALSHFREDPIALAQNAASGQKIVEVDDASIFYADALVKIEDDNGWEYNRVASTSNNTITMESNLVNAYAVADNATVTLDLIGHSDTSYTEMIYIDTTIYEILKFICDTADLSGVIGFDMRIEYDGKFAFFAGGTKNEAYSLSDSCQLGRYHKDSSRIRNRIWVKGKADKPYPLDVDGQPWSDAWTEKVTPSNWTTLAVDGGTPNDYVDVTDASGFAQNDIVWLKDLNTIGEICTISSVSVGGGAGGSDRITMTGAISYSYTTGQNAIIFEVFSNGGWGFVPYTAGGNDIIDDAGAHTGSHCIEVQMIDGADAQALVVMMLRTADWFSMDDYSTLRFMMWFDTTAPTLVQVRLYSGDAADATKIATSQPIKITGANEWTLIEVSGDSNNSANWTVGGAFDWANISGVGIYVLYAAVGAYTFYIDRGYAIGKRWGGGNNDAAIDGYAEDTASILKFAGLRDESAGYRELVLITDLLLSDAECEAKAQALKAFYKDEHLTVEVLSNTLDWENNHPMAKNKVALDLDFLGVTGQTYLIDSIGIYFRSADNALYAVYTLEDTPPRIADYLYSISERLRQLEKNYSKVR